MSGGRHIGRSLALWELGLLVECKLSSKQKLDWAQCSRTQGGVRWVKMMSVWSSRQIHGRPLTGCYGLTTLALIQGDTQPSNLLSAQFQWTMEFSPRRYTILVSALRLAARLMRLRLPTGEPNGVKTKVLLWTNNPSLHFHAERRWLLANTPALSQKCIYASTMFLKRLFKSCKRLLKSQLKCG